MTESVIRANPSAPPSTQHPTRYAAPHTSSRHPSAQRNRTAPWPVNRAASTPGTPPALAIDCVVADPPGGSAPTIVVLLRGVVEPGTAPLLETVLRHAAENAAEVRCDLAGVTALRTAGVSALVAADAHARRRGSRLVLTGARGECRRVLDLAGVACR
ncbi:hypothetical protein GCM10010123_15970 [Pilimelia anulata]|uniref:STAS domain-containing protein n=1 Tax=Pilimelia anulata TaxID=53371 RepID=A0A8J3FBU2_9ACTN|nr:STAS domain-containing protein [Pilimelia anulata]GGJ87198.1 hypothetical protein GCM10010123_15970 [Pilimelia anulata]